MQEQLEEKLSFLGQAHLLEGIEQLPLLIQKRQKESIAALCSSGLLEQQKAFLLRERNRVAEEMCLPYWDSYTRSPDQKARDMGEELLRQGRVACLVLSGGSGSRLGWSCPKAMVPVTCVKKKTLLQIFCEKTLYAGRKYTQTFPLVLMTSSFNQKDIQEYLEKNRYFGLKKEQVYTFVQNELPFCDDQGNWILEAPGTMMKGPDGNGFCLHQFYASGLWTKLQEQGIDYLNVIFIDNPLADPFDPEIVGVQHLQQADVAVRSVLQTHPKEKVGLFVSDQGALRVVEYSEIRQQHQLGVPMANTGLFSFSFPFIDSLVRESKQMRWHLAYKKVRRQWPKEEEINVWKFEYFLFDVLDYAKRISVLLSSREDCFSPLKNASGEKSAETVKEALRACDRKKYQTVTGQEPPAGLFELSFAWYYRRVGDPLEWKTVLEPEGEYLCEAKE